MPLDITVVQGTGSLYWNRGMVLAYQTARASALEFDAYMLYNDDILLDDSFLEFLRQFSELDNAILAGAFREPATGEVSYSGVVRVGGLRPFTFVRPELTATLVSVDTFDGNCVLIPAKVFEKLGGLDPAYTHSAGDYDFGLRAGTIGVRTYTYGTPIGYCERGPTLDERIRVAAFRDRWRLLFEYPHGLGPNLRFVRKHGLPLLFPVYAARDALRRVVKLFWRSTNYPR
jgi:GT2 family glycosyltransferase